jgi:hypothetical protein
LLLLFPMRLLYLLLRLLLLLHLLPSVQRLVLLLLLVNINDGWGLTRPRCSALPPEREEVRLRPLHRCGGRNNALLQRKWSHSGQE